MLNLKNMETIMEYIKVVELYKFDKRFGYIEIHLKENEKHQTVLSIVGSMKGSHGQIRERIMEEFKDYKKIVRICEVWERWHLNNLHAGCVHQREFEKEPYEKHKGCHCDICNYTYGHDWQFEEIPQEIIDEIQRW